MILVPVHEAFEDTPLFRDRLHDEEKRVHACRDSITRIIKINQEIVRLSEAATAQRQLLIAELDQPLFDEKISGPLSVFRNALKEIEERRAVHAVQIDTVMIEPLLEFRNELDGVVGLSRRFESADAAFKGSMDKYLLKKAKKDQEDAAAEEVAINRMSLHKLSVELGGKLK
ncbi:hypothetical protein HK101_002051 [Irineochytrium annulatum]|nr:hypothetical protein HK101_002051 [Irineochytrium annulatum]